MELALEKSAVQTDSVTGGELAKVRQEGREMSAEALKIFENRVMSRTLKKNP